MKKEETKKANDPVGEYLVNKIKELESERERILKHLDLLEEKASKFEELQSLFTLEHGVICLYNKKGGFEDAVAPSKERLLHHYHHLLGSRNHT